NGNTALSIARRLGYISVVDTLKVVTEETLTTMTVTEKHKINVPETMNEVLDMSDDEVRRANVPEMLSEDYISDVEEEVNQFNVLLFWLNSCSVEMAVLFLATNSCHDITTTAAGNPIQ
ncbi:ankyrin-3, partial [Tachysurus ichikawai]